MISLKSSLEKIGEPEVNQPFKAIPRGFHSFPQSLSTAVNAMNPPLIENWKPAYIDGFYNQEWTQECQGIATDGSFWYIVSNNKNKRAVYKFSLDFDLINFAVCPENKHVGHPAVWGGKVYVPLEPQDHNENARVWELNTEFSTSDTFDLGYTDKRNPIGKMPWCAINPWNSSLYSSISDGVDHVCAYNPSDSFSFEGILEIEGEKVDKVQGGWFTNNGHLYLSSEESVNIRGYSVLNGKFLGSFGLDYGDGDEIEGLCLGHFTNSDGISSYVHVIILDNEDDEDDVFINHFFVPDPSVL
jgi:hypothetical protein